MTQVPTFDQLMVPLFTALRELGGSASIAEIDEKVGELLALPEETLELPHNPEKSNQTEFQYRLAWARTYMKQYGLIDNSQRGVWVIAPDKRDTTDFDPQEVVREVRERHRRNREESGSEDENAGNEIEALDEAEAWRQTLHRVLTEIVDPTAFERLVQRLLRESGFIHVEVTGRSGDGGIDGIISLDRLGLEKVYVQAKKWKEQVGSPVVREFVGALQLNGANKGVLITSGTFSKPALEAAELAKVVVLIDGETVASLMIEHQVGASTRSIKLPRIDSDYFEE